MTLQLPYATKHARIFHQLNGPVQRLQFRHIPSNWVIHFEGKGPDLAACVEALRRRAVKQGYVVEEGFVVVDWVRNAIQRTRGVRYTLPVLRDYQRTTSPSPPANCHTRESRAAVTALLWEYVSDTSPNGATDPSVESERLRVGHALARLNHERRDLKLYLDYYFLRRWTRQHIAEILHKSPKTVAKDIERGLDLLIDDLACYR